MAAGEFTIGKKSGPKPPDPVAVSQAQTQSNKETAELQQRLNMVNSTGPYGSVQYAADPNAPGGYSQTTTLSPQERAIYDLSNSADQGALRLANDHLGRIGGALSSGLSTEGLPELRAGSGVSFGGLNPGAGIQSNFDKGRALQYDFDPGQAVQGQVGGDLDAARQQAIDAVYGQATSRLDPRFERAGESLDVKLANQGLSENSAAAQNARDQFGRERTDAYNQAQYSAIGAGEDAAQALFQRQLGQGQFANEAAAQMYGQNQGQAGFHNATAGQDYGQNLGAAQFSNDAQSQGFQQNLAKAQLDLQKGQFDAQQSNQARQQGLQERAYIQNQPIDQFSALMGGGQVSMPQGIQYSPTQVQGTDVLGAYALNQQAQQANAARRSGILGGAMGGLMGLGQAAIMGSDARLKEDIRRVGDHPLGIGVYEFRYKGRPERFRGVIAQELEKVRPDLVIVGADGMRAVNYANAAMREAA